MAEAVGRKEHASESVHARVLVFSLYALVFCTGAASLATEIGASRLLAPYYGSSTIVWANVIGLVLASLAVGYWVGGKLADRNPSPRLLGQIVVLAAVLIAIIPFGAGPFLDVSVKGLDQVSAGAAIGSFFAVLALFAPALILLGMVAPFAIRLAIEDVRDAGSVAGRLYALSTVGSLLGTFLAALVLIPSIGTRRTLLLAALVVALSGAALLTYYRMAESLLAESQNRGLKIRLGECARRVMAVNLDSADTGSEPLVMGDGFSLDAEVMRYEGNLIRQALESSGGSVTRAARLLGVTHQGLAFILNGRHNNLMSVRTPVKRRRKSIIRYH